MKFVCLLPLIAAAVVAAIAAVAAQQCGVIGEAQFCNETVCFHTETSSSCDGLVRVSDPVCDVVLWVWFPVSFGSGTFDLYESPERAQAGYSSAEEAARWYLLIRDGQLVNCTITNSTAFVSDEIVITAAKSSSGDDDSVTTSALFWVPTIIIIICLCIVAIVVAAAIAAIFIVAKTKADEKF